MNKQKSMVILSIGLMILIGIIVPTLISNQSGSQESRQENGQRMLLSTEFAQSARFLTSKDVLDIEVWQEEPEDELEEEFNELANFEEDEEESDTIDQGWAEEVNDTRTAPVQNDQSSDNSGGSSTGNGRSSSGGNGGGSSNRDDGSSSGGNSGGSSNGDGGSSSGGNSGGSSNGDGGSSSGGNGGGSSNGDGGGSSGGDGADSSNGNGGDSSGENEDNPPDENNDNPTDEDDD